MSKYTGTGTVAATDYHAVKWVGKTKSGKAITIKIDKAINIGNIDWTFAEKDESVMSITFTGVYSNTDSASTSDVEPWSIETTENTAGASEIILGAGVFYIDETAVALTRGGGSFNVEREFHEINADGDRGPVEGRIEMVSARPSLTFNTLQMLTRVADMYAGISVEQ